MSLPATVEATEHDIGPPAPGSRGIAELILIEPSRFATAAVMLILVFSLVGYPIAMLVKYSLIDQAGHVGLQAFSELMADHGIFTAAITSLRLMVAVSVGCVAVGVPLAWLAARTDMPGKVLIRAGAAVAFIIPSFVNVIAWIFLAAPNSGLLNKALAAVFGRAEPLFNIFSFGGLVFIETAHLFPLVFFAVSAALGNIDTSHEQAARVLGAGRGRTTLTITLPLVAPAIISSLILCMLDSLSSFGAPAAIGTMANFSVLSTAIYGLLTFPPRLELAAAASVIIALYTFACLWI